MHYYFALNQACRCGRFSNTGGMAECRRNLVRESSQTDNSKYETGERDIPTYILIHLARIYNTSIDYLLRETNNPQRYQE